MQMPTDNTANYRKRDLPDRDPNYPKQDYYARQERQSLSGAINEAVAETRIPGELIPQAGNGVKPAFLSAPVSVTVARVVREQRRIS
jgi:hypothetical protein